MDNFAAYVLPVLLMLGGIVGSALVSLTVQYAPDRATAGQNLKGLLAKSLGVAAIAWILYLYWSAEQLTKSLVFQMAFALCGGVVLIVVQLFERMLDLQRKSLESDLKQLKLAAKQLDTMQAVSDRAARR